MIKKESKIAYCERLGINYFTILAMISKGVLEQEAINKLVESKKKLENLLDLAQDVLGKSFNSRKEIKDELERLQVKDNNHALKRIDVRLILYKKLRGTPYEFIIVGKNSFSYQGINYPSLRNFTIDNKILVQDMYRKIFSEDGEISDIINSCMDNDDYKESIKPIIGNNKYKSIKHLADVYNIDRRTYHKKIKGGMSFEDALTHCIGTRERTRLIKAWIPGVYKGTPFKNMKELSALTNISVRQLNAAMREGKDRDEYIELTSPKDNYYKQFRTVDDLILHLDIANTLYYKTLKDLIDIETTVNYLLSLRFKLNGKIVMPTDKHLLPTIRLTNLQKMKLKQTLTNETDLDKKSYLAEEYLTSIGKL